MLPDPDQTCPPDTHDTHWPVYLMYRYRWCHDANMTDLSHHSQHRLCYT